MNTHTKEFSIEFTSLLNNLKALMDDYTDNPTVITYNDICSQLEIIRYKAEELIIEYEDI